MIYFKTQSQKCPSSFRYVKFGSSLSRKAIQEDNINTAAKIPLQFYKADSPENKEFALVSAFTGKTLI